MYQNIKSLMAYYIQRQRIVLLAMLYLNPSSLAMNGDSIEGIDLELYLENYAIKEQNCQNPIELQLGVWKNEWKFWVHGIGCRLIHVESGEPIEWDAPNIYLFRFEWFWQHLMWRCEFESEDPVIMQVSDWVKKSLEIDVETEMINRNLIEITENGTTRIINL
jgi:hypothetical protein